MTVVPPLPTRRPLTVDDVRKLGVIADQHRMAHALRREIDKPRPNTKPRYLHLSADRYSDEPDILLAPDLAGQVLDVLITLLADAAVDRYGIILATPQEPAK